MMSSLPVEKLPRRVFWGILLVFAVLSLGYSLATPLKYGPDEPAHFIYIRSMATDFAPPIIAHSETHSENSTASHEGHQPPLYYAIMALPFALLKLLGASTAVIWRLLRIVGLPIGIAWIYLVYRLCREFFGNETYALASAAFTALIPTSAYMSGVLSNDVLVALLFTWALIPMLGYLRSGEIDSKSAGLLGVGIGLAILAKAQGLVLLPAFALVSAGVWRRRSYTDFKAAALPLITMTGVAGLVCGWWFVRSEMLYGTLMPQSLSNPVLKNGLAEMIAYPDLARALIWHITSQLYGYFWTPYWLIRAYLPWRFYISPLGVMTVLVLGGFLIRLRRKGENYSSVLAFLSVVTLAIYVVYLRYVLVVDFMANQQGRLFLPVAAVAGIVAVLGLDGWLRSLRAKKIGAIVVAALMVLTNIVIMTCGYLYYAGGGA